MEETQYNWDWVSTQDLTSWSLNDHENGEESAQNYTRGSHQWSPGKQLITHYAVKDWNPAVPTSSPAQESTLRREGLKSCSAHKLPCSRKHTTPWRTEILQCPQAPLLKKAHYAVKDWNPAVPTSSPAQESTLRREGLKSCSAHKLPGSRKHTTPWRTEILQCTQAPLLKKAHYAVKDWNPAVHTSSPAQESTLRREGLKSCSAHKLPGSRKHTMPWRTEILQCHKLPCSRKHTTPWRTEILQWPQAPLLKKAHYAVKDWNPAVHTSSPAQESTLRREGLKSCSAHKLPCSRKHTTPWRTEILQWPQAPRLKKAHYAVKDWNPAVHTSSPAQESTLRREGLKSCSDHKLPCSRKHTTPWRTEILQCTQAPLLKKAHYAVKDWNPAVHTSSPAQESTLRREGLKSCSAHKLPCSRKHTTPWRTEILQCTQAPLLKKAHYAVKDWNPAVPTSSPAQESTLSREGLKSCSATSSPAQESTLRREGLKSCSGHKLPCSRKHTTPWRTEILQCTQAPLLKKAHYAVKDWNPAVHTSSPAQESTLRREGLKSCSGHKLPGSRKHTTPWRTEILQCTQAPRLKKAHYAVKDWNPAVTTSSPAQESTLRREGLKSCSGHKLPCSRKHTTPWRTEILQWAQAPLLKKAHYAVKDWNPAVGTSSPAQESTLRREGLKSCSGHKLPGSRKHTTPWRTEILQWAQAPLLKKAHYAVKDWNPAVGTSSPAQESTLRREGLKSCSGHKLPCSRKHTTPWRTEILQCTQAPRLKKAHVKPVWRANDSEENWVKVLWSDETKIQLFDINSTLWPQEHHPNQNIMLWGVFLLKGQLHRIKGTMDGAHVPQGQGIENGSWMGFSAWQWPKTHGQGNTGVSQVSTLRSWSGRASLQTFIPLNICGGSWRFVSLETLMTWRGSAKRNGVKSLLRCVRTCDQLQETPDLCDRQQGFCHQVLSQVLRRGQILISLIKRQIN